MKIAGSLRSLRGINATGPVGMGAAFAKDGLVGGDTGRIADWGKSLAVLPLSVWFDNAVAAVLAPLLATIVLSLPAVKPVKTALGAIGASGLMLDASCFVLSLSFWRFAAGSPSVLVLVDEVDGVT